MDGRSKKPSGRGKVIGRTGELAHGMSKKFRLRCQGRTVEGMLLSYEGNLFAYVNRCRHISLSLDWADNEFFSEDKRYVICANHGAVYEPTTGECVWGPCYGAFLQDVPIRVSGGRILAYCPELEALEEF
jgi:nitrite reductase/ring-hydroxylating ferredoxin subunit